MKKIFEWIQNKKNRKKIVTFSLIAFLGPLIIIYGLFKIPYINKFFVPPWNAGEILGYLGAFYTLIGTAVFSCLALRLNYAQKQDNDASQKRLDNFNTRLINIDEKKIIPVIDIAIGENNQNWLDRSRIELVFNNIGENAVKGLNTFDFSLKYENKLYTAADSHVGGIASRDNINKFYIVMNPNINFGLTSTMEIDIKLGYQDIMDRLYRKKYILFLSGNESGKLKITKEQIEDLES